MRAKPRHAPKERPPDPHAADSAWRLFIAIPIPAPAQAVIATLTDELNAGDPPVRWTAAGSAHLTLHFLGEVEPARAELLRLAFPSMAKTRTTFDLRTAGLGCFPEEGPPKVVWLGLDGQIRELMELQRAIGLALPRIAIQPEDRAFRPHITLGRVRDDAPVGQLNALRARILDPAINQRALEAATDIPATRILLVRSYLERTGARHETIAIANLRARD
jgi:RNA 2',3'-cyclic 3'-phosphodiesterase